MKTISTNTSNDLGCVDFNIDNHIGPVRTTVVPNEEETTNRRAKRTRTVLFHINH